MIENLYDKLKRINLVHIILAGKWGYELDKAKTCKSWVVLCNGKNKLLIKNNPNQNGHWIFTNQMGNEKGTIIDFLLMEGSNDESIREEYGSIDYKPEPAYQVVSFASKPLGPLVIKKRFDRFQHEKGIGGYLGKRGITPDVIRAFLNKKGTEKAQAKNNRNSAIFPLFLEVDTSLEGEFSSFIEYNSEGHYAKGQPRGLSVLKMEGDFSYVYICESPIDALSLEVLHRKHKIEGKRAYMSTCGYISNLQLENLKKLLPLLPQKLILAFDNDAGGRRLAEKIQDNIEEKITVKYPKKGKDWNDALNLY